MSDKQYNSYLHQRLFVQWANSKTIPVGPRAGAVVDQLDLDRFRGHIIAEGYGAGCSLAEVLDTPAALPAGMAGCLCEGCIEYAADLPSWAPCRGGCGSVVGRPGDLCAKCRGA